MCHPQRQNLSCFHSCVVDCSCRKINELEEELKVVGNNMKALEIAEQEVDNISHNTTVRYQYQLRRCIAQTAHSYTGLGDVIVQK